MPLLWVAVLLGLIVLKTVVQFLLNLRRARSTGLPILVSPVSRLNLFWIVIQEPILPLFAAIPFRLGAFTRWNTLKWWFRDRYRLHQEVGNVFLHVSPGAIELHSADPTVNSQIFAKRSEIDKTTALMKASRLGFGDSLTSVTGPDWVRHRRATIPQFNERNNRLVWNESTRQAMQVGAYFQGAGTSGCNTSTQDWLTVTLNILIAGALGETWDFKPPTSSETSPSKAEARATPGDTKLAHHKRAYHRAVDVLCGSLALYVLTPHWMYNVPSYLLPGALREFITEHASFKTSMDHMIEDAKQRIASGKAANDATFLTNLVMKSEEMRQQPLAIEGGDGSSLKGGLSQSEVYGNIFLYNLAGHETTASTLGYAVYLFAAFPEYQEWIWAEVDEVFPDPLAIAALDYPDVFPKLKRVMAVMMETLRLYGPINAINKATVAPHNVELFVDGRSVLLPPGTYVIPNVIASHTLPEFWGESHLQWKPDRWIDSDGSSGGTMEAIRDPPNGRDTYFPWSSGGRSCPGKKFSQVEFVAIIAVLLRRYKFSVVPRPGETPAEARRRCFAVVEDSQTEITLRMKDPWSVNLQFEERT